MCVICYKPAGQALPSWDDLERCFIRNADGAGFMYPHAGKVHWVKGLMTFARFKEELLVAAGRNPDILQGELALHFRIGTHGDTSSPKLTHPFPLSADYDTLTALRGTAQYVMVHNGILRLPGFHLSGRQVRTWNYTLGKWTEPDTPTPGWSDTMEYILNILWPLANIKRWMDYPVFENIIDVTLGTSKLVIFSDEGKVQLHGEFEKVNGCLFSNTHWKNALLPSEAITQIPITPSLPKAKSSRVSAKHYQTFNDQGYWYKGKWYSWENVIG